MTNLNKVISTTRKLIDLPYNRFNLENCFAVLHENELNPVTIDTAKNLPIKLMSGDNFYSRIITSNYFPNKKRNIYIIGKGVLFDSGGYNLKTGREGPYGMHDDKAGMIIALNVANYVKGNISAFCPCTTNFLHNSKIIPGDIIKIGKKEVLVNNTDAEGRLLLAEAISTLNVSKNDIIISIATLTGCCEYAVDKATGVFSDNDELVRKYADASHEAQELAWCLPMFDYMNDYYKKQPIKNSDDRIKAGASQGAVFLKQFCKYPNNFIHLDIARSAFDDEGRANGVPVKTLIKFIKKLK